MMIRLAQLAGVLVCIAAPLALVYLGVWPPVGGLLAIDVAVTAVFWRLRDRIHGVLLVFLAVLFATTVLVLPWAKIRPDRPSFADDAALATTWTNEGPFDTRLPVVLHLIFDELASPGSIDLSLPEGPPTREALLSMAERHRLRTFDSVYSRYFFSAVTIPNLVNEEYRGETRTANVSTAQRDVIRDNPYFDDMAARGYRTAVFQTSHLNFCANPRVVLCETFDSFDPGGDERFDERSGTLNLWRTLLRAYEPSYISEYGTAALARIYGLGDRAVGVLGIQGRYDVQRFPAWFERFTRFAAQVPRGTHVFAHFMAPHAPYLLTPDCVVSGQYAAGYYLNQAFPDAAQREAARRTYASDYLDQVRCVASEIDGFLAALGENPDLRDATVIIHGDHGSRISAGNVLEDYEPRDFIANYATYFAVK